MSSFFTLHHSNCEPITPEVTTQLLSSLQSHPYQKAQYLQIDSSTYMGHALFKTSKTAIENQEPYSLTPTLHLVSSVRLDEKKRLRQKLGIASSNILQLSDAQLILYAYQKWGERCTEYLFGDFAFVIYDTNKKKIFGARDRFGIKQLYYSHKNTLLLVANRLQTLLIHPAITKTFNPTSIGAFLLFGRFTWIDKTLTMFQDIYTLAPAHQFTFINGKFLQKQYWSIPTNISPLEYKNPHHYIEHFLDIFQNTVADRITDDHITISMSGGMDSTAIAAMAKKYQQQTSHTFQLDALTVTDSTLHGSDEYHHAQLAAKYIGISLRHLEGSQFPYLKHFHPTTYPIEAPQPQLWFEMEKHLGKTAKIVLVGDGADELFAYPSTRASIKRSGFFYTQKQRFYLEKLYQKKVPRNFGIKTQLKKSLFKQKNPLRTSYPYPNWIQEAFEEEIQAKRVWEEYWSQSSKPLFSQHKILEKRLMGASWCTEDRLLQTPFFITEKRDPYLDVRMIEFVLAVPPLPWLFNKHILRESMKDFLPAEVRFRPKTILKNHHQKLAQRTSGNLFKSWQSLHTSLYIKDNFHYQQNTSSQALHYIQARVIILDHWLSNFYNY